MAKDDIRKDSKGRKLRNGESQGADGRYRYQYQDTNGKRASVYSWTLTHNDAIPVGKKQKQGDSLREKEQRIDIDLANQINSQKGNMSVYNLLKVWTDLRWKEIRESTRNGYRTNLKFMEMDPFGQRKIKDVSYADAETWMQSLHDKQGKGYSSLHTLKGMLNQAFLMAKRSRWVIDNPFDFSLNKKRYGGTKMREALSRKDMRRFLDFVQSDNHFSKYYDGIFILFGTGLRISEFCGLTKDDIDFVNHVIHVRRQLIRVHDGSKMLLFIEEPKSVNGVRDVPMMGDVEIAFENVIKNRPQLDTEPVIYTQDGKQSASGFLWFDKNQNLEVAQHWQNHLRWAAAKFNRTYKDELPDVSPHVCRHTFCSNCAGAGMNPKTLQVIMGHSDISMTLNVYTHLEAGDIMQEFTHLIDNKQFDFYKIDRKPETVSLDDSSDEDEGEVNFDEEIDDDE